VRSAQRCFLCPFCESTYELHIVFSDDESAITMDLTIECPCGATFVGGNHTHAKEDP